MKQAFSLALCALCCSCQPPASSARFAPAAPPATPSAAPALAPRPDPSPSGPARVERMVTNDAAVLPPGMPPPMTDSPLDFVVMHTAGAQPAQSLPMVLVLHGLGDHGPNFVQLFRSFTTQARVIGVQGPIQFEGGFGWFPMATEGRDAPAFVAGMRTAEEQIATVAQLLPTRFATCGRPIVVGFSQGAMLSFALAAGHPERIAAAVPFAGMLPRALWPSHAPPALSPLVLALHGLADTRIPPDDGRAALAAFTAAGYTAEFTPLPGVAHDLGEASMRPLLAAMNRAVHAACPTASP